MSVYKKKQGGMIKTGVLELAERTGEMPAEGTHEMQDIYLMHIKKSTALRRRRRQIACYYWKTAKAVFPPAFVLKKKKSEYSYSVLLALLIRINIQHIMEIVFLPFVTLWCPKYNLDMLELLKIADLSLPVMWVSWDWDGYKMKSFWNAWMCCWMCL